MLQTLSELARLPKNYAERLKNLNVPAHLKELLVKVITVLLQKIDVSQDEIDTLVEKIDERGVSEMIAIENYSVQETRKQARAEAMAEAKIRLKFTAESLISRGNTIADIAIIMGISESDVLDMLKQPA